MGRVSMDQTGSQAWTCLGVGLVSFWTRLQSAKESFLSNSQPPLSFNRHEVIVRWEGHRGAAGRVYCGTTGRGPSGKIRTGALLEDKDPSVELFVEGVELFVEGD
ncbi:hypothetical protein V6N11_008703 [Hibiscus sabdariffa]|uniref:Uncharacterized protein n=2 Tax=Hibiscus sabdariffa TaxID=183260 RepID=A0ABR2PP35_9ROSI